MKKLKQKTTNQTAALPATRGNKMEKYKVEFCKTTSRTIEAENQSDLLNKTDAMKPGEKVTESYPALEDELEQDILEFAENWRTFLKLLVKQPFYHDLKISEDNVITEPRNWPHMYNAMEVCQLAEVCGLLALVTIENGKIIIRIS